MALTIKIADSLYVYQGNGNWFVPTATDDPKWPVSVSSVQLLSLVPVTDQYTIQLINGADQSDVSETGELTAFRLWWWKLKANFGINDNSDLGRILKWVLRIVIFLAIVWIARKIGIFSSFKSKRR